MPIGKSRDWPGQSLCLLLVVLVLVFAGSAQSQSQPLIPDTPAGRTFAEWLEAFNSADAALIRAYLGAHQSDAGPGATVEQTLEFRGQTGGFDLLAIESSEPRSITFSLRERARQLRAFGKLDVDDRNPPHVLGMQLNAIPGEGDFKGFTVDGATRTKVIDGAIEKLRDFYVFPDTADAMAEALREHQRRGDYDEVTDGAAFARLLTGHLQEVSHDRHLRVNFSPVTVPQQSAEPTPGVPEQMRQQFARINCGFEKVEHLAGNVGYLKFNQFGPPEICGATASAAMAFLKDVDALVVDLRDNGGGSPDMVAYLSSYLFAERTHLNDLWTRSTDETNEFWTRDVPGELLADEPVYVLTSARTFSGAEEFTYNLKSLGRATVVGETTGGGAHPTRGERLTDQFTIGVPFARAINPITKTNWEGTGVEPDVKVPADEALDAALGLAQAAISARPSR